ncbi:hypothetical protein MT349_06900 [Rathayibacter caricis]|uniref:hypothetical protein n=1 Tax=Rathayibacter caricis TaxID=110936 RepID=UPI001FB341E0|nr:hypothetical protein [Rathayibacter caricis]MCJ1695505.1 hypothetical protein [Rathayibacter caricis]
MSDHLTDSPTGGIQRRTIVAGASWSIPVVATAIGAPLAAASNTGATLAFTNGPYSVAACGTLKDVVIRATTNGTTPVTEGTPITVTLPSGLTWSNGDSGSRIVPADTNGEAVLSGLKGTASAGTRTISASTADATTTAPVSVLSSPTAVTDGFGNTVTGIPAGATIADVTGTIDANGNRYLFARSEEGTLYVSINGAPFTVDSTSTTAVATNTGNPAAVIRAIDTPTGPVVYDGLTGAASPALTGIPAGRTVVDLVGTIDANNKTYVFARTDDDTLYVSIDRGPFTVDSTSTTSVATNTGNPAAVIRAIDTPTGPVVYDGLTGAASPALTGIPAGRTVVDLVGTIDANNKTYVFARTDDNTLYVSIDRGPFTVDSTSTTAVATNTGNPAAVIRAIDTPTGPVVYDGLTGAASPALTGIPAGRTVVDLVGTIDANGVTYVFARTEDGSVYVSVNRAPFALQSTGATALATNTGNPAAVIVASQTATC